MNYLNSSLAGQVIEFCAQIGSDALLVQGPGGNVSWKEDGVLWIKASGKWLADAKSSEIFVPVSLLPLQNALAKSDFTVVPKALSGAQLRPSIETLLHVLMPHKIVLHLHPVEMLAHLVRNNQQEAIARYVGQQVNWIYVDYAKPGAELAKAVSQQLVNAASTDVIFLGNHGVLIGGENIKQISLTLNILTSALKIDIAPHSALNAAQFSEVPPALTGSQICTDVRLNQLALDERLAQRLRTSWALYPDHVVFLGAESVMLDASTQPGDLERISLTKPPFIFAIGHGVYERSDVTLAQKSQLRCYYDVVIRQPTNHTLTTLSQNQVWELVSWESEKHRVSQDMLRQ
jgi:rhamnose utilization protein RhaD (predicted bifunctional aldolase and dehydrogenase)